jgi:hypothetical protein
MRDARAHTIHRMVGPSRSHRRQARGSRRASAIYPDQATPRTVAAVLFCGGFT